jgi:EmrB/QacA subfamily drug resistance transporter
VHRRIDQKLAVAVVFVAAMFMSIMDITIVNVALPTIGHDFGVKPTSVDGVSIAFLVSLAVFIPASGWLGDRFGGKRVLLGAIIIFTGASALCGLATSITQLILFRVLQGIGGGMLMPVGMAMLFRTFPPSERVAAASLLAVPTALAPAVGPVLGGLLVSELSWRYVFLVNVPIGIAAVAFGAWALDSVPEENVGPFDLIGFLLAATGLGLLMYGVSEGPFQSWGSSGVLVTIALGIACLIALAVWEFRRRLPLIDVRQLGDRNFRIFIVVGFMSMATILGVLYVATLFYQDGRSMSALDAGLSTFPEAVGVMIGARFVGRVLYPRLGPRRNVLLGSVGLAAVISLLALVGAHTNLWIPRLLIFVMGLFMSVLFVTSQAAAFATISPAATGRASTTFNAIRQLGGAIGVALFTTVIVAVGAHQLVAHHSTPHLAAYHAAFLAAAGCALLGALAALRIDDRDSTSTLVAGERQPRQAGTRLGARRARSFTRLG